MGRAKWRAKCPLDQQRLEGLLKEYFALAIVQKDGSVAWKGFEPHDYHLVLLGCIEFGDNLPRDLKERSLWKASNECAKASSRLPKDFIDSLNRSIAQHYAERPERATIVTKVSCAALRKTIKFKVLNFTITIHSGRPGRLDISPFWASREVLPHEPDHYLYVTLQGEGRTISDKFEQGLRELSIVGAFLNLIATFGSRTIFTSRGNGLPLRRISFGKYFLLYDKTGRRHEDRYHYLYDDELAEDLVSEDKFAEYLRQVQILAQRLRKHPLRDELRASLLLYHSALEARDIDAALMRMWSATEQLAFTSKLFKGDETVKRLSSLFSDGEMVAAKLTAVRENRNRSVHLGDHDEFGLALVQCCKMYFERTFLFYLNNKIGLKTRDDLEVFLTAPVKDIKKRIKVLEKRVLFERESAPTRKIARRAA